MDLMTRRRALALAMTLPVAALALTGCDPNPGGPAFPTAPKEEEGDAAGGPAGKGATGKGRRKANPTATIGDPAK